MNEKDSTTPGTGAPEATTTKQELAKASAKGSQREIYLDVENRVGLLCQQNRLNIPPNYSVGNALNEAWLMIQQTVDRNDKPALEVCNRVTVANAMFDMVIQGLSPIKKQCYFIVYGAALTMQRSYFGTIAVLKRIKGVGRQPFANVIYEGDTFEYEIVEALITNVKHKQAFGNIKMDKILGAYAILEFNGQMIGMVMTMDEIRQAWAKAKGGIKDTHKQFPQEMAKKTVLGRLCKAVINTSDDSDILIDSFNNTDENEFDEAAPSLLDGMLTIDGQATAALEAGTVVDVSDMQEVTPGPQETPRNAPSAAGQGNSANASTRPAAAATKPAGAAPASGKGDCPI